MCLMYSTRKLIVFHLSIVRGGDRNIGEAAQNGGEAGGGGGSNERKAIPTKLRQIVV